MTIAISPPGLYSSTLHRPWSELTTASPRRSSPLSAPPLQPGAPAPAPARPAKHISIPRKAGHGSSPGSPRAAATTAAAASAARSVSARTTARSPTSPTSSPPTSSSPGHSLSRSQPLAGSYPLSLLHARMATHTPHSAGEAFGVRIRAVATAPSGSAPRAPAPLLVPFHATYYDLALGDQPPPPGTGASHSPWVGDVDLESHFFTTYTAEGAPNTAGSSGAAASEPPAYPGYRVPPVGQLQLLIKTAAAAVHAFIVPYDVSSLVGGARLLARERTYVRQEDGSDCEAEEPSSSSSTTSGTSPSPSPSPAPRRETLRYAVQLQFACVDDGHGERAFYLARTLKLVFTSAPPEHGLVVRTERADEVVPPPSRRALRGAQIHAHRRSISSPLASSSTTTVSLGTSPGSGSPPRSQPRRSSFEASADWAHVRAAWRARAASAAAVARGFDPPAERPVSPAPPLAAPSPRSLLSALAPEDRTHSPSPRRGTPTPTLATDSDGTSNSAASNSGSGTASSTSHAGASAGGVGTRRPGMSRAPSVVGNARRRLSREERELSARLRAMDMDA